MQVGQQTRYQKKRAKMAAKKEAKANGLPMPKPSKNVRQRRRPAPKPVYAPEPKPNAVKVARTHAELYKLMEAEKHLLVNPGDIDYPDKPAYEMGFYVPGNLKNLKTTLEFPDEKVTFIDSKKCCAKLCKMLTEIGYKAIVAEIENSTAKSLRIFICKKEHNPLFRYYETEKQPNILEHPSVRTEQAPVILDIIPEGEGKTKLFLTNIDGNRISVGSFILHEDAVILDTNKSTVSFAKDIEFTMRCALNIALEDKLYKIAKEYFEGDMIAVFLPARVTR